MTKRVLVAGATGYLGGYLLQSLRAQGFRVRALVRREQQAEQLRDTADEVVVGEITVPAQLAAAVEHTDCVISAAGITRQKDGLTYMDVDYQGNLNLLRAAQTAGVPQFIYISAIDGDKFRHLKIFAAKERFADALKQSGLQYSIIRPNGYFSDMGDFLTMAATGRAWLFGHGGQRINPISGRDLAEFTVQIMQSDIQETAVGGPDILSLNDIYLLAGEALNQPVRIIHLPDILRRAAISLLRTLTPQTVHGPAEFFLTFMGSDHIAPQTGRDHLRDFYARRAAEMREE